MSRADSTEPVTADVVICAYTEERWDDIVAAVASVTSQTVQPQRLILVVDHNDSLLRRAQEHFEATVTIVANRHKNGLSGARNTGIAIATADVVAFLDDDAEAQPTWLEELLSVYADPHVMGAGGLIRPIWQTSRPAWWPGEFDWVVGCSYVGLPETLAPVRNPIGASMSVRRSAFETVGGFSEAIGRVGKRPVGCEETELFIRIHQQWPTSKVLYVPSAVVGHKVPAARARFAYFRSRCFAEGLSKAVVSKLVGSSDGLSSERTYTTKVLPAGVLRGLKAGAGGKRSGFASAGAIVAGLGMTSLGYARGSFGPAPSTGAPTPIAKVESS